MANMIRAHVLQLKTDHHPALSGDSSIDGAGVSPEPGGSELTKAGTASTPPPSEQPLPPLQGAAADPAPAAAAAGRLGRRLHADEKMRSESRNYSGLAPPVSLSGKLAQLSDQPDKGSLLPKFGDWDVNDPASGVGFTAIFEKVADEKKAGSAIRLSSKHVQSLRLPIKFKGSPRSPEEGSSLMRNWCCCFRHVKG